MPPIRNQLRRNQRAVRVPARDDHEDVEMAFINIEARDIHREVNVVERQRYARLQLVVLAFMELVHRVPRVCAQWFMNRNA
ncbi:hypothetical protein K435DRAFT_786888 [Dendrothele bispora CBS 962.96]|uniref:Uncharacterized protein n=1 Tax=Dendrothele bispora (strain CBS 962.96) TaxID=1314807 RepID=A0A4S8KN74_DENBC|nr:hypothetical protein K435DRAFT_786888 [Dendrothele bispora CBS 962.96]